MEKHDVAASMLWRLTHDGLSDEVVATVTRVGDMYRLAIVSGVEGSIMEESYPDIEALLREASEQRFELERQGWGGGADDSSER
jgi:hypothetical protein